MPANLGYISALLFNQNNCAAEASTVTTKFEVEVGSELCVMMGYKNDDSMGHLVAGGSIANIEAIWAARNVKYFPLGLQEALLKEDKLSGARNYKVICKNYSMLIFPIGTLYVFCKNRSVKFSGGRCTIFNTEFNLTHITSTLQHSGIPTMCSPISVTCSYDVITVEVWPGKCITVL